MTEELVEVQIEQRERAEVVVARLTGELDISGAESTGKRIAEAVPSAGFVAFRPQQGEESLPGTAEISANGEHCEGSLGTAFGQRWRRRTRALIQGEASEHPESEHADPCLS